MASGVLAAVLAVQLVAQSPPAVDHHQHLFNPAHVASTPGVRPVTAEDLVRLLDEAGIRRAVVFSVAYQFGNPNRPPVDDEYGKVKAENDWTSEQVARFPDRLRGFCGVNPLKDYALDEIARCARDPRLRTGLKLHFGNSDVLLDDPQHIAQLRRVFQLANTNRMAMAIHMRSSVSRRRPYGKEQAQAFLDNLVSAAPDVTVQIAHMAGGGSYDEPSVDEALGVFIAAIRSGDARMKNVYFDASGVAGVGRWAEKRDLIATRIREIGVGRVLYGSDGATAQLNPTVMLAAFHSLPLSDAEFRAIEGNIAPYMR
jgi:predicted TIM-barrel fold metal-dependent hydrolase